MSNHIFVGFGFGPIQSGLFVSEAFKSRNFKRIVIAEIDPRLVDAVRANQGRYAVSIAASDGIETSQIEGVEIYNPSNENDRAKLLESLCQATEICTSLPSVNFFDAGQNSVAALIAQGLQQSAAPATIIYTAENNNHAAEILEEKVRANLTAPLKHPVQFLNTVIGKMSQVVTNAGEIKAKNLTVIAPGVERAFLVEAFNKILVTKCHIQNFKPGVEVFIEKENLLPFEEAKLYGHNAIHALLAYLGAAKGYTKMAELKKDAALMQIARKAFIDESGAALTKKYAKLGDALFTPNGFRAYAEDLLERMTNPYLDDTIERAARDPQRKLGFSDRIFGTIHLVFEHKIEPVNMAMGAIAGIAFLLKRAEECKLPEALRFSDWRNLTDRQIEDILKWLWHDNYGKYGFPIIPCIQTAKAKLIGLIGNG
jgi:mannitol-1-phosphate 5-dehydrogenase